MSEMIEELNDKAMQIIIHAGDGRSLLNEVIIALINDADSEETDAKFEEAKKEITKAHIIQTEVIQKYISNEEFVTTLLFTHAQDTLMTINSEMNIVKNMLKLYRKLEEKINER